MWNSYVVGFAARWKVRKRPSRRSCGGSFTEAKLESLGASVLGMSSEGVSASESVATKIAAVITRFQMYLSLH